MGEGLTNELLWEGAVVLVLASAIASRSMRLLPAVLLALVRVSVPVLYFAWYFDGQWTMLDDQTYFATGAEMVATGLNPMGVLATEEGRDYLYSLQGGQHFLYFWWNLLTQYIFGEHYYAPVLVNVLVTFGTSAILFRTALLLGFSRRYSVGLQVFYLLQWDVVAWSSFVNLKDCLVQFLSAAALYFMSRFLRRRDARSIAGFLVAACIFSWIRFYVPFVMLAALAAWSVWQLNDWRRYALLALGMGPACLMLPLLQAHSDWLNPALLLDGSLRFALTPLPWRVSEAYSFLVFPAILHLAFVLPALVGMWELWRASAHARLYLIYLLLIVLLYGVTEELQDPRHRFQIVFILAWAQFHVLWELISMRETARTLHELPAGASRGPIAARRPMQPIGAWS